MFRSEHRFKRSFRVVHLVLAVTYVAYSTVKTNAAALSAQISCGKEEVPSTGIGENAEGCKGAEFTLRVIYRCGTLWVSGTSNSIPLAGLFTNRHSYSFHYLHGVMVIL